MNTKDSIIEERRIEQAVMNRYSPVPELTMALLNSQLNQFRIGDLRNAARTWEIMLERDGELSVPADKLFSDIARLPVEVEKVDDSAEADRHYESLKYFIDHLTARSVLEGDETGGINLLLRQMMTAHALRYSVHEIVLQINSASKREVTADFLHCPVWFFEAKRGRLAYLKTEYDQHGTPLEQGRWLAAVGRGMMRQCSVAYLAKWQATAYNLLFCYRFGIPGIHGETDASKGSQEWNDFVAALSAFANDWVTATNRNAKINLVEASKGGSGTLPFAEVIERADRLFARCFRGGDLSTQSRVGGDVSGSNAQEGEKRVILEDGGQWATDILNARVVEPLIAYLYKTTPKAWLCVRPPKQIDANREINSIKAARELGVPVSIETARERLELPAPEDGEELITPAAIVADPASQQETTDQTAGKLPGAPAGADVQATALNGAQVTALAELAANVAQGLLPLSTAQSIATAAFPLVSVENITRIFGPLKSFTPEAPAQPEQAQRAVGEVKALANEVNEELRDRNALARSLADDLQLYLDRFTPELDAVLSIQDAALRATKFRELWARYEPLRQDLLKAPGAAGILEGLNAKAFASGLTKKS